MPSQIIFPCPNCGATQSVDETTVSTQCQFCGNTITVPENLRPKPAPPDPALGAPQTYSFGGATGTPPMGAMPGLTGVPGLPSMFMNMDVNKLMAMAKAARSGDVNEAARLYSESFGVSQEDAMQAAQLMMQHHPVVLSQFSQMQFDTPQVMQMAATPQVIQPPTGGMTYNLPSPPAVGKRSGSSRLGACFAVAFFLFIAAVVAGTIIVLALARTR